MTILSCFDGQKTPFEAAVLPARPRVILRCSAWHGRQLTLPARSHRDLMDLVTMYVKTHTPAISITVRATSSKLPMAAADCLAALTTASAPSPDMSGTRKVFTGCVVLTMTLLSG